MLYRSIIKQTLNNKLNLRQWLLISCCFSCVLSLARIVVTGEWTYLFLVWNLFLAFIPYAISEKLFQSIAVIHHKWKRIVVFLAWVLFIPNSFYIVTDLFHLDQFDNAPKWFDLLLLFSFGWNGLLLGILSVRKIELILEVIYGKFVSLLSVGVVMFLNALGIYIGRYLRYNSWDVVFQPFSLFQEILDLLIHPLRKSEEWGMISAWALFMTLFYITIKKAGESFISSAQSNKQ